MCDRAIFYRYNMVIRFIVFLLLSSCAMRAPDSVGVSIEDLEGFGNPDIEECNITFDGSPPTVPCVIEVQVEWEI